MLMGTVREEGTDEAGVVLNSVRKMYITLPWPSHC